MKPSDLAFWLSEIVPDFIDIEGNIFVVRNGESLTALKQRAGEYATLDEAQRWMNVVLIDAFLDEALGKEWETNDAGLDEILNVYVKAWTLKAQAQFPNIHLSVEVIKDDDDVGIRLVQQEEGKIKGVS